MKLAEVAKRPQLIEVCLDDEETVQEYGEAVTFWTWDRQPMPVFLKMASINQTDYSEIITVVKDLVLDEAGKPIITDDVSLPMPIMLRAINRCVEQLGK